MWLWALDFMVYVFVCALLDGPTQGLEDSSFDGNIRLIRDAVEKGVMDAMVDAMVLSQASGFFVTYSVCMMLRLTHVLASGGTSSPAHQDLAAHAQGLMGRALKYCYDMCGCPNGDVNSRGTIGLRMLVTWQREGQWHTDVDMLDQLVSTVMFIFVTHNSLRDCLTYLHECCISFVLCFKCSICECSVRYVECVTLLRCLWFYQGSIM